MNPHDHGFHGYACAKAGKCVEGKVLSLFAEESLASRIRELEGDEPKEAM